MGFVIHWQESAMDLHVFPIPIPPPTSLSTGSLWVFPVHQVQALVSCIQPGLVICFTLDNIHVLMLFSWNIPPLPSPTESKNPFLSFFVLFTISLTEGVVHVKFLFSSFPILFIQPITILFLRPSLYWASQVALVVKNLSAIARRYRRHGFYPWVGKTSWRRKQQPPTGFLPGESHGQRAWWATFYGVMKNRTWLKWLGTDVGTLHWNSSH